MTDETTSFLAQSRTFELNPRTGKLVEVDVFGVATATVDLTNVIIDSKFQILSLLGQGGMGAVFRARHLMLDKDIALKTFRSNRTSPRAIERFHREVRAVAKIDHPNIIQVYDSGLTESNQPYYTMELLIGLPLDEKLKSAGAMSLDQAITVFTQVAEGLRSAHNSGIVHRDLKPANIFLSDQAGNKSVAKVVDFGIAKLADNSQDSQFLTAAGTVFGSPLYMSPEQCSGDEVDKRSDIYSFGCTLFEALTGRPPLVGKNAFETMIMHQTVKPDTLSEAAPDANFPPLLESFVARLLHKDPVYRPASFDEIVITFKRLRKMSAEASAGGVSSAARDVSSGAAISSGSAARAVRSDKLDDDEKSNEKNEEQTELFPRWAIVTFAIFIIGGLALIAYIQSSRVADNTPQASPANNLSNDGKRQGAFKELGKSAPPKDTLVGDLYRVAGDYNVPGIAEDSAEEDPLDLGIERKSEQHTLPAQPFNIKANATSHDAYFTTISRQNLREVAASHVSKLSLQRCKIENEYLSGLSKSALRTIDLSLTNFDDSGAEALSGMTRLENLQIDGTRVSDAASASIAKLHSLNFLNVSRDKIGDASLVNFATMPKLRELRLVGTRVTIEGVTNFCALSKSIKELHLATAILKLSN